MIIRIADLPLEWQKDNSEFVSSFSAEANEKPIMKIKFEQGMAECHGIQYSDMQTAHVLRSENGELLCANDDWSMAVSYFSSSGGGYSLPLAAICSKFSYHNAVLVHASCVDVGGEGVIFTGFSGVGKTTQARLWQKYLNADIINGDKAFVREIGGSFYGCGLPWKGSSEYCLNRTTRLKTLVVLRQAQQNKIRTLDTSEIMEYFMPHIFMPHWDSKSLETAFNTVEKIIETIPVMLLECRPDEEAVRLAYNSIFG